LGGAFYFFKLIPVSFIGSFAEVTKWIRQRQHTAISLWFKDIGVVKFLFECCDYAASKTNCFVGAFDGTRGNRDLPGEMGSFFLYDSVLTATDVGPGSLNMNNAISEKSVAPGFWHWAAVPPLGWNSYDSFGDTVTEGEVIANARYMKERLLPHGWNYVVIDFRWYDPEPIGDDLNLNQKRTGARLEADAFGRVIPAPNRFPSAAGGAGFKPLADQIHALGLKFGFHMMRGIPRQAVLAATPIEGSSFTAAEAGNPNDICSWCPDMYGVYPNAAGQAWYDAMFHLYVSWGLDFIKVDDLSIPYRTPEIEMIRKAIDHCGRPIVLSTSAGPTDVNMAAHIQIHANMWRISADFWDTWAKLDAQFDLLASWQGAAGPGHWPDADMIPLGRVAIRSKCLGEDHQTHLTHDEQKTLMSLWALAPSPLMLGMNLPDNDAWTLSLLTNDEVLNINQDPLGKQATRISQKDKTEVWGRRLMDGSKAVALFNRGNNVSEVGFAWHEVNLAGTQSVRDVWDHQYLGQFEDELSLKVPPHGVILLRIKRP
jgi:alpha-galactosidase